MKDRPLPFLKHLSMRFYVYGPRVIFVPAFILVLITAVTLFTSILIPIKTTEAAVPQIIYYQGKISKVSDGTNIADGNYSMQFKLYTVSSGGVAAWTETWDGLSGTTQVSFKNGMFSVALGTYTPMIDLSSGTYYLGVNFNPGAGYDGEMTRQQLTSAPYALVSNGVSGTGAINTALQSATALTVANSGTNYAFQVDTNTGSSVTGLKVTSNISGSGVALNAISGGTNENITLDAKGSGTITIGTASGSSGDILLGGGSGSTGCTVTNSTGAFACTAGGSFTTLALTGAVTGAASYNGLVVTANTGVITTGTWQGTAINAGFINFNSTNLQNSSNALNTIQNINTTATPQFAGVGYGTAGSATNLINASLGAGQRLISATQQAATETSGVNLIDLATTWNNATNTPTAIKLNVTDTASNANSLLFDIGTGGGSYVSKFKVDKSGNVTAAGNITENGTQLSSKYAPINANFVTVTANATLTGETGIDALTTNVSTTGNISTTGSGTITSAGLLSANGGLTLAANQNYSMTSGTGTFTQNHTVSSDATADAMTLNLTANGTGSTGVLRGLVISQADTATTGVYDSLAYIANLKTPETTTNGIFIENNGASNTLTNGINITNTAGTLSNGISFSGTMAAAIKFNAASDIDILDNSTTSLTISEAANQYLLINTDNTNTVVTLDTPVAGATSTTLNLGTAAVAKTINIGSTSDSALKLKKFATANQVLYVSATDGTVSGVSVNAGAVQCLTQTSSAAPVWGSCGTGGGGVSLAPASADSTSSTNAAINITDTGLTSNAFINLKQTTSALTGTGLLMDFASGSGTFASGNFLDFRVNTAVKFKVDNTGSIVNLGTAITANAGLTITSTNANLSLTSTTSGMILMQPATPKVLINTGSIFSQAALQVLKTTSDSDATLAMQNNYASGYTGMDLYNSSGTYSAGVSWGNASSSFPNSLFLQTASTNPILMLVNTSTERLRADSTGVTFTGNVISKTSTNSSTAFQVQNAAGAPLFLVDTTSTDPAGAQVNYLAYSGFETGSFSNSAAGWAAQGAVTSFTQNTNKQHTYNGLNSGAVVSSAANQGMHTGSFAATPPGSTTYIVSFYAKISSGTINSNQFSVTTVGGAGGPTACTAGVTINSSGFQRVSCTVAAGAGNITDLQIIQTVGANTIYYDSVQMQKNTFNGNAITVPTAYQFGAIQIRGLVTNPLTVQNNSDSTQAFQVNTANGTAVLTTDTLNGRIGISTSSPTAKLDISAGGATKGLNITATSAPTADLANISNSGQVNTSDGINGLQIDYYSALGNAAFQSSSLRLNITNTSATAGSTTNGLRIVTTANVVGNTNGIKIDGITSNASATDTAINIAAGWDTGLAITTSAAEKAISITAGAVPTSDLMSISNSGQVNTSDSINGLQIDYFSALSNAAFQTSSLRLNITNTSGVAGSTTNGLRIVTTANVLGNTNGIKIDGITSNASATDYALNIGTGWDNEIALNDTTPNIKLTATDNTSIFSITDASNNNLFELRDYATAVQSVASAGAFIDHLSYIGQEFSGDARNTALAANGTVGDDLQWNFRTSGATATYANPRTVSGVARLATGTTSGVGSTLALGTVSTAAGAFDTVLLKANLPVMQFKFIPVQSGGALTITTDYAIGMMDTPTTPSATNDLTGITNGIYLWTNNQTTATGGSLTLQGVVRSGGANVGTVSCTGNYTYGNSIVARIQVESSTSVHFLIDFNAADGINWIDCGSVSGANPTAAMTPMVMVAHNETTARQLDVDYIRIWQDDALATQNAMQSIQPDNSQAYTLPLLDLFAQGQTLKDYTDADLAKWFDDAATRTQGQVINQLSTDRLTAGLEVITPSVKTKGLKIDSLAALTDLITINSDTEFIGRPYFNSDTAGFAKVKQGDKEVDVTFDRDYLNQPIINASVSLEGKLNSADSDTAQEALAQSLFDQGIQYVIIKKTVHGFTIVLNKPAPSDINFSWIALAVKNPKLFESKPLAGANVPSGQVAGDSTQSNSGSSADNTTPSGQSAPTDNAADTNTDTNVSASSDSGN